MVQSAGGQTQVFQKTRKANVAGRGETMQGRADGKCIFPFVVNSLCTIQWRRTLCVRVGARPGHGQENGDGAQERRRNSKFRCHGRAFFSRSRVRASLCGRTINSILNFNYRLNRAASETRTGTIVYFDFNCNKDFQFFFISSLTSARGRRRYLVRVLF